MIKIFHKPHQKRHREAEFVQTFQRHFPNAELIPKDYPIQAGYLENLINVNELIKGLEKDNLLSSKARNKTVSALSNCPDRLKVALKPNRISVDVVVEKDGKPYYWEFHEEQHRRLSISRPAKVYSADNKVHETRRYVQRLIRDVWRAKYLRPYTIVWFDWFGQYKSDYKPLLQNGFAELVIAGTFSFQALCNINETQN